jgi:hypothetical protein
MAPTTVMKSVTQLFTDSKGADALSADGLAALANFDFTGHILFYVVVALSALLIIGIVYGFFKDRSDTGYWAQVDALQAK